MSKNNNISISLIVPALNEEKVIQKVLEDIYSIAKDSFNTFEIIAINDGSADATLEMMNTFSEKHKNINIINNKVNIGLGASFQAGLGLVKNEYVMLLCGDGGLPATSLPKIFEQVGNADLIIPYMSNLKTIKRPSRYVLSKAYVYLLNTVFGLNLNYYNGLPVYRKELLDKINITSSGFGFQAEIIIKLLKSGCTFHQVEVKGAEETGRSHALKFTNILSVANTFLHLIKEIVMFKPIVVDSTKTPRN
jgi:glycosyltransferase involved in cell wall biosynthesis